MPKGTTTLKRCRTSLTRFECAAGDAKVLSLLHQTHAMVVVDWIVLIATVFVTDSLVCGHVAGPFRNVFYATDLFAAAKNVTGVLSGDEITTVIQFCRDEG